MTVCLEDFHAGGFLSCFAPVTQLAEDTGSDPANVRVQISPGVLTHSEKLCFTLLFARVAEGDTCMTESHVLK